MGLLDDLARQVLSGGGGDDGSTAAGRGAISSDQTAQLVQSMLRLLDQNGGGIAGMAQRFQQHGLGDVLSSWVGTGNNRPISPEDLTNVLGRQNVEQMAAEAGVPPQQAPNLLAQLLPVLIDQLTPNGRAPQQGGSLLDIGLALLRGSGSSERRS